MNAAADIYNQGDYLANNPKWHADDSGWKAGHIDRLLTAHGIAPRSIVEVGCGAGGVIAALAKRFPEAPAVGFDISADAATLWPAQRPANLDYRRTDFLETGDRADLICLIDVFEHVDDYLGFLRALRSRARWFVFHIPLDLSVLSLARRRYMRGRAEVGHLHYFTRESALATLATAGYTVRDWRYTALALEAGSEARTAATRLANLPRRLVAILSTDAAATWLGGYSLLVLAEPAVDATKENSIVE